MRQKANRSAGIDLARIIGLVAVIAGHVWSYDPVRTLTYSWHVPMFFMLTGYLWRPKPLRDDLAARWRALGIPYLVWGVGIGVAFAVVTSERYGLRRAAIDCAKVAWGGSFAGRPFTAFWFYSALLLGAVALRILQRGPSWLPWSVSVLAVIACTVKPSIVAKTPFAAGQALACVLFILLGIELAKRRHRIRTWMGPVMISAGLVAALSGIVKPLDLKYARVGTPVLSILVAAAISTGLIIVCVSAERIISAQVAIAIVHLNRPATVIILSQGIVLWALATPPTGGWLDFAATLVIPWAAGLFIVRTPASRWLNGTPQAARA